MAQTVKIEDLDFLQELIDTPDPPKGTRTRKPKDTRDEATWFKLNHIVDKCLDCGSGFIERGFKSDDPLLNFPDKCMDCGSTNVKLKAGQCSQGEHCVGLILYEKGPIRVTAIVNEIEMCRYCFLDGLAHVPE